MSTNLSEIIGSEFGHKRKGNACKLLKGGSRAKYIFRNLTGLSGLKKSKKSGKQKLLGGAVTLIPDTPKDILTRLNLLLGTRGAGNNSLDIRNELVQLIDIAAAKSVIKVKIKKG